MSAQWFVNLRSLYAKPFISLPDNPTVANILLTIKAHPTRQGVDTFIVFPNLATQQTEFVIDLSTLEQALMQNPALWDQTARDLPLSRGKLVEVTSGISASSTEAQLQDDPDIVVVLTEKDIVIDVLYNQHLGGIAPLEWLGRLYSQTIGSSLVLRAYFPEVVVANQSYPMYVYVYAANLQTTVEHDYISFERVLQHEADTKQQDASKRILPGTPLRFIVIADNSALTVNPSVTPTQYWNGTWLRFEITLTVAKALPTDLLGLTLLLEAHTVEIAQLHCVLQAEQTPTTSLSIGVVNPLHEAKLRYNAAHSYARIFCSYSRKDTLIVQNIVKTLIAVGNIVFLDVDDIATGDSWRAALANAIDDADIFLLFWSSHSAVSPNVQDEWMYCLQYKCPQDKCVGVLRPVYWEDHLPHVPAALRDINFRRLHNVIP